MLSGGERRRLALAVVVASGANFLVLDEPTNHLDLESREALEAALENFPATVLLVSHDRALLDAVAERTLAIEDGTIRSYDGGWADYVRAREDAKLSNVRASGAEHRVGARGHGRSRPHPSGRTSSSGSRRRSPARKRRSPSSSGISPTTGPTSSCSRRTAPRATSSQSLLDRWETLFEQAQA